MLLDDIMPFWMRYAPDHEHGGFLHHLDREGRVYSTDKGVWIQCRAVWMLSTLYNTVEKRQEWLDAAASGYDFVTRHAFDEDGRMFFLLTREGVPLRKRRYLFSESFGAIACNAFGRAAGDDAAVERGAAIFRTLLRHHTTPGLLEPKLYPAARDLKSHAMPMIILATAQELREGGRASNHDTIAAASVEEILRDFVKPEIPALLEHVARDGARVDVPAGRLVNPGHAIETSWFLMREARRNGDEALIDRACDILDWSLALGWDDEYGGLFSFVDCDGWPCEQLEWDMKLWWPHTEALYALLLAHHLTGDTRYEEWFERIHEYTMTHFPDPEHGEWFGYLHRDGTVSHTLKGGLWKGPFHVPRALLNLVHLTEEMVG
ncbi:MAG: AGE family epimerase/isomerase [Ignavibacteriae bacterium]|nr:AGE family epimerase/isomerase [Ignavibacteriota bacterium]